MSKITPEHLARQAVVYIRQSTPGQVVHNLESKRRQYNLPERARQLGWCDVAVIDDDLGRSGSGVERPGFEKLLVAICEVRVGVVVSIEASRLARNGRDWIEWKLPVYNTILHILTNPIYAGAYAFGRTGSRISIEAGRKKVVRTPASSSAAATE
jgi:hypothetical protein